MGLGAVRQDATVLCQPIVLEAGCVAVHRCEQLGNALALRLAVFDHAGALPGPGGLRLAGSLASGGLRAGDAP